MDKPPESAAIGFLIIIGVPILLILLMITIIGIPFSILGFMLFAFIVWVASIYGKFSIGTWLLSKVDKTNKWAALILGLLVGVILGFVPIIGDIINFVILLLGLGAITYALKDRREKKDKTVVGS
jgi:hypothetical protein